MGLSLTRKINETITITAGEDKVVLRVTQIKGRRVHLHFEECPDSVLIDRDPNFRVQQEEEDGNE